jgi:hypothetical protein
MAKQWSRKAPGVVPLLDDDEGEGRVVLRVEVLARALDGRHLMTT